MDQMVVELVKYTAQFGIGGLFFLMWMFERKDRLALTKDTDVVRKLLDDSARREEAFTQIIVDNTVAITANTSAVNQLVAAVQNQGHTVKG